MSKTFPKLNISLRELTRPNIRQSRIEIVETPKVSPTSNNTIKLAIVLLSICVIFIINKSSYYIKGGAICYRSHHCLTISG